MHRALEVFKELAKTEGCDPEVWTYLGCCYFFLGNYKEADAATLKGPASPLQNRLLFHLSHKFNDEKRLMSYHHNLQDVIEDQLTLASIHYLRSHYQEAIDIYKRMLLENRFEPPTCVCVCMGGGCKYWVTNFVPPPPPLMDLGTIWP